MALRGLAELQDLLAIVRVDGLDPVVPDEIGQRALRGLAHGVVAVGDAALGVAHPHHVRDRLDERAVELLLRGELLLGQLPLRDVHDRDEAAGDALVGREHHQAAEAVEHAPLQRPGDAFGDERRLAAGQRDHLLGKDWIGLGHEHLVERAEQLLLGGGAEHDRRDAIDVDDLHHPGQLGQELGVRAEVLAEVTDARGLHGVDRRHRLGEVLLPERHRGQLEDRSVASLHVVGHDRIDPAPGRLRGLIVQRFRVAGSCVHASPVSNRMCSGSIARIAAGLQPAGVETAVR